MLFTQKFFLKPVSSRHPPKAVTNKKIPVSVLKNIDTPIHEPTIIVRTKEYSSIKTVTRAQINNGKSGYRRGKVDGEKSHLSLTKFKIRIIKVAEKAHLRECKNFCNE